MKKFIFFLLSLIIAQQTLSQQMITDFLYREGDKSSNPTEFIEFNQMMFFVAKTESFGREIWVKNGNENESYILKDINPGINDGMSYRSPLSESSVIINNTLYFIANDGNSNGEIWKTNGTTEGTEKLTDFLNSDISKLTLVNDRFYFLLKKNDLLQVWISDGTKSGTKKIKGNLPIWNRPSFQGKCNDVFIFTFQPQGTNNSKVWRSDGTSSGTFPITNEIDGNGAGPSGTSDLTQYIEFNNELYFVTRKYLYKTDGTLENTIQVTSMYSATTSLIDYADVVEANGKLYFSFFKVSGNQLFIWESDGTEAGTLKIYDKSSNRYFMTSNLLENGNSLIFCGVNENGGTSLIDLNLTDYSLTYIKELQDSTDAPFIFIDPIDLCNIQFISDKKIFCSSKIESYERVGWISELTTETTEKIESLNNVLSVFNFDNLFYFSRTTESEGNELWESDGTENNTFLADNINRGKFGLLNDDLIQLNSNLIFTANDGSTGEELWKYDGTNTVLIKNIRKGGASSLSNSFIKYNNEIYFVSNDDIHGNELWKTNGEASGTNIVHDILEGKGSSLPDYLTVHNDILYFIANHENHYHLCKSDGINFEFIKDLGENSYGSSLFVTDMVSSGDNLYLTVEGAGTDLWISDGTGNGTYKLKDFSDCNNLTDVNGKLFFTSAKPGDEEKELWTTDGTDTGTKLVKDIGVGYSSSPEELINFNGTLFFTAYTNENGREIWKSTGTENGTEILYDINSGSEGSIINANFYILNDELLFNANDGYNGFELWKTDGSGAGTSIVKDINSGIEGSFPSHITAIQDSIYFQAYDKNNGTELWKSDGTENGTVLVADILPGVYGSTPTNMLSFENDIYFVAGSENKGRQIWKISNNKVTNLPHHIEAIVYPNPCTDHVYFNISDKIEYLHIYNLNGQMVSVEKPDNNYVNLSHLPTGPYFIKFDINDKSMIKKIIKK